MAIPKHKFAAVTPPRRTTPAKPADTTPAQPAAAKKPGC